MASPRALIVLGLLGALLGSAAAQEPAAPRQPFRSAVDRVVVDVSVMDRDGRPIDGLGPADFSLAVDGRARRVASAEFVRPPAKAAAPRAEHFSTNAGAASGRLIAIVVDQGNIGAGRARAAVESALRFIKRLTPADRIALYAIPGPGPQIPFTANHALVQSQLTRIAGQVPSSAFQRLGLAEAVRIERGDAAALQQASARECAGENVELCEQEIGAEARDLAGGGRARARASLASLRALLEQLAENDTPKTLVLFSEALVVDEDKPDLAWVGPLAGRGRVSLHVLRLDVRDDGARARPSNRTGDAAVAEEGLAMLADHARGSLFRVVGSADGIFSRLALELSGYYLLSFEPEPGERDGAARAIRVEVPARRGAVVRARRDFRVEPDAAPRTVEQVLASTLRSPVLASDIRVDVTAYTFRAPDSGRLRILIAADIDRSQNPRGALAAGYVVMDERGAIASSHFEKSVTAPVNAGGVQQYVIAATVESPGIYGLRLAVVDDEGRQGSVDHAFRAQLTPAGPLRSGDLLIGGDAGAAVASPAVAATFDDPDAVHGYLEIYGESGDALSSASVTFEVAERADARALESVPARTGAGANGTRRVVEASVPVDLLPPGSYHARAVVTVAGRKVAQVARPFRIARSAAAAARRPGGARGAAPLTARVDDFQPASVLGADVVGYAIDRAGQGAAVPDAVLQHARGGRFEAAASAARAASQPVAAAFLEGLRLFETRDLEAAAVKFREALRLDSEFFPAAFYLGACYASGGRDRDASAAWQTALAGDADAAFIYPLLGDALLRQREVDAALDVLHEAAQRWPADAAVQARLAMALAMAGRRAEALRALDLSLSQQPADADRLFLGLRIVYEARAAGQPVESESADRARFDRYAAAYVAAGGPQLALVEQWRRFMDAR